MAMRHPWEKSRMKTMTTMPSSVSAPGVLLVTIISATIALTALADVTTCAPAPPGLVGWWAGEGNASDSAGTNNGALHGGMSFAAGEAGQAFNFNGSSGYVDMPASASPGRSACSWAYHFWYSCGSRRR